MKSLLTKACALGIALSTALALSPAMAAPAIHLPAAAVPTADSNIIHVQQSPGSPRSGVDFYRGGSHNYRGGHGYHGHRSYGHRSYGRHHYYRNHHRYYRHGGNGAGVAAGLIAGAVIGGVVANGVRGGGSSHTRWCYNHYRSYRASDNTYQPYNGPRRQCNSPY